jgi:hypothetical protein
VVLTSPVLAMATYTTTEPPTCATNVDATWTKGYFMAIIRQEVVIIVKLGGFSHLNSKIQYTYSN